MNGKLSSICPYTHIHTLLAPKIIQNGDKEGVSRTQTDVFQIPTLSHQSSDVRATKGCSSSNTSLQRAGTIFPSFFEQKFSLLLCNRSHYSGGTKDKKKGTWAQVDPCHVTAISHWSSGSQSFLPLKQGSENPQPFLLSSPGIWKECLFSHFGISGSQL